MKPKYLLTITFMAFLAWASVFTMTGANEKASLPLSKAEETQTDPVFEKIMSVITHERCMNCHPSDNQPRQGERSRIHSFGVKRGPNNTGLAALQCASCHQTSNNSFSGVPGAPHWSLAPKSMGWVGLNKYEIAAAILDKSKNGNRSLTDIEHHLTQDSLVLWAFEPGVDNEGTARLTPPITKEEWVRLVKQWIASGAEIPKRQ